MYTTSKHGEPRQTPVVKDAVRFPGRDLDEDLLYPAELESWTIEELSDFLPRDEILATDEFEAA